MTSTGILKRTTAQLPAQVTAGETVVYDSTVKRWKRYTAAGWVLESGIVTAMDYGVAGDGTTDDTTALQAALTAVPSGGGEVFLPAGTYIITGPLVPVADTLIRGTGKASTYLKVTATTSGMNAFTVTGKNRVCFEKLRIGVNGNSQRCIEYAGAQEFVLRDVMLQSQVVGNGIGVLVHSAAGTGSYNGLYQAVQFENLGTGAQLGVSADSNPGANVHDFIGCKWSTNGTGLLLNYVSGVTVVGGRFENNTARGIDTGTAGGDNPNNVQIYGTYFENNTTAHLRISARCMDWLVSNPVIVGGTVSDNGTNSKWIGNFSGTATFMEILTNNVLGAQITATGILRFARLSPVITIRNVSDNANTQILGLDGSDKIILAGDGNTTAVGGPVTIAKNLSLTRTAPAYTTTVGIDASLGNWFDITVTDAVAFTVANPTNAVDGQRISVTVRNASGTTTGTTTFGTLYKMSAWTAPANTTSRTIDFKFNSTNWVEASRTPADVPN